MSPENRKRAYGGLILISLALAIALLDVAHQQFVSKGGLVAAMVVLVIILSIVMPRLRPQQ